MKPKYLCITRVKTFSTQAFVVFLDKLLGANGLLAVIASETLLMVSFALITNFLLSWSKIPCTCFTHFSWGDSTTWMTNQLVVFESETLIKLKRKANTVINPLTPGSETSWILLCLTPDNQWGHFSGKWVQQDITY